MEEVMKFVIEKMKKMMENFGGGGQPKQVNFGGQLLLTVQNFGEQVGDNFSRQVKILCGQLLLRVQNLCGEVVKYWLEKTHRDNFSAPMKVEEEEAKKLKQFLKRKKDESERLAEIEKRQKQRLEEMKETQKKEVENMKLKERIRAEVEKELSKLEMKCHDMASLLRGLGITVGGDTSHEVRVAYRKALMKFHPDRVLRSDIRQQIEAEEKFKLISRMKDKYLPTI
ncbi:hypothetical protein HAX54_020638 [Datura stramonium]|uniref:J domain-containing protein n=1 Tax=Datura stramonium TaxID=4076 RepID=A0ABS8S2L5_DATST|nr:hypothetical protein [Datura stramonium]